MKNLTWGLGLLAIAAVVVGCSDPSADMQRQMAARPKPAAVRIVNFTSQDADLLIKKVIRFPKLGPDSICKFQAVGGGKNEIGVNLGDVSLFEETIELAGKTGCSIVLFPSKGKTEHLMATDEVRNADGATSSFRVVVVGNPDVSVDVTLGGSPFATALKASSATAAKNVQGTPAEAVITCGKETKKVSVPLKNGDGCTVFVYVKDDGTIKVLSTTNAPDREPIKSAPSAG